MNYKDLCKRWSLLISTSAVQADRVSLCGYAMLLGDKRSKWNIGSTNENCYSV